MKNSLKSQWKSTDNGFTLVELIVAITILAILAALLIPSMVGWIDRAKEKSYAVEARAVYLAAQTVESDHYDGTATPYLGPALLPISDPRCEEVKKLSGVNVLMIKVDTISGGLDPVTAHDILAMRVQFIPKGKDFEDAVIMQLQDGTWTRVYDFEDTDSGWDGDWEENEIG